MTQLEFANSDYPERETYFCEVIIPVPVRKLFTYRIPRDFKASVQKGSRVVVPFGTRKVLTGGVATIHDRGPEHYEARYLLEVLDTEPIILDAQFALIDWVGSYYMCSVGEVAHAALPSGLRLSSDSRVQANPDFDKDATTLTEKEDRIWRAAKNADYLGYEDVSRISGNKQVYPILKSLISKGAVLLFEELKEKYSPKAIKKIRLAQLYEDANRLEELFEGLGSKPKQLELLMSYLRHVPVLDRIQVNKFGIQKADLLASGASGASLKTLIKNNVFEEFMVAVPRFELTDVDRQAPAPLSDAQSAALEKIAGSFNGKGEVLLHGVTGSGKTEIYIHLINRVIEEGKQALYLLPEIALTTQIVKRLHAVFGDALGVYHSRFSDNERVEIYRGLLEGRFKVILGVRSAVFLPFHHLGMVIIDEEHDASYKQNDPAPRYNGRDAAIMLGRIHGAKVLLGSATPSVESFHHALSGKWGFVTLDSRYNECEIPEFIFADTSKAKREKKMNGDFSPELAVEISAALDRKEQVLLFYNRRGYAYWLNCDTCNWIPTCPNCAVSLTYYQYRHELRCHYCGTARKVPANCPSCGNTGLKTVGFGTEKIEDDIGLMFPKAQVQRMDLDSTRRKHAFQQIVHGVETGQTDILVGTQMITKGFDFANVTLVGIFNADRMLHFPDFRAAERTFQIMTQVSGRAGRREKKGKVVIQTNEPGHPLYQSIVTGNYASFFNEEIKERHKFGYPPYTRLIKLTVRDADVAKCREAAMKLAEMLVQKLSKKRILGPEEPHINKVRNKYIREILIKVERENINLAKVKEAITTCMDDLSVQKVFKTVEVTADVDPV